MSPPRPGRRWLAVAGLAAGLFVAAVVEPPGSGLAPAGPLGLVGRDKWLHAAGYAALAVALAAARRVADARAGLGAVLAVSAYGLLLEAVQAPLSYRAFALADAAANATGAALGVALWALWVRWRRRRVAAA